MLKMLKFGVGNSTWCFSIVQGLFQIFYIFYLQSYLSILTLCFLVCLNYFNIWKIEAEGNIILNLSGGYMDIHTILHNFLYG